MMLGMRSWTLSCMEATAFCVRVVFCLSRFPLWWCIASL
jgi:hypothetical protein